jgi:hypothetical protein
MTMLQSLQDNPIFVKHLRSRLRSSQLWPSIAAVMIPAALITWAVGVAPQGGGREMLLTMMLMLQGSILFLAGTTQVANSVAQARDGGVMDFHRISPMRPEALTLGFLLGGPIREYLLYACTLPFMVICSLMGAVSLSGMVLIVVGYLVVALVYHAASMMAGLVAAKPRGVGGGIVALIFLFHFVFQLSGGVLLFGPLTVVPVVVEAMGAGRWGAPAPHFFGIEMPALLVSLLHQIPLLIFLFIASARKLRSERAYFYSKPQAVLFFAVLSVLLLGDAAGVQDQRAVFPGLTPVVPLLYVLMFVGIALSAAVTPTAGDYANGVRQARKRGQTRAPIWTERAPNWAPVLAFVALLLGSSFIAAATSVRGVGWTAQTITGAFIGACVIVHFASAKQAFDLMYRKNSQSFFALYLFMLWIVPLLVALVGSSAHLPDAFRDAVMGISPLTGVYYAVATDPGGISSPGGAVAVGSSLLLVVCFVQLRLTAERRAAEAAVRIRE